MEYKKTCAACGSFFVTQNENQSCCSSECGLQLGRRNKKKYYTCQYCGEQFWKPDAFRKKYCSKECQMAARSDEAMKRHLNLSPASEPEVYQHECLWCKEQFETPYPNKLYCSPECAYEGNKRMKRQQWADEYAPHIFTCLECGLEVKTECGDKHSLFCSERCMEKYHSRIYKKQRKQQMRSAWVEPVTFDAVYYRSNGVCGICGLPVSYDKSPSDIWAATIDHIVPLPRGGKHELSNCQLAHRLCNSTKQDDIEDYHIDWAEKNKLDNGRWTDALTKYSLHTRMQAAL